VFNTAQRWPQIARVANQTSKLTDPTPADLRAVLRALEGLRGQVKGLMLANVKSWESGRNDSLTCDLTCSGACLRCEEQTSTPHAQRLQLQACDNRLVSIPPRATVRVRFVSQMSRRTTGLRPALPDSVKA
jgi:hypothetical protein